MENEDIAIIIRVSIGLTEACPFSKSAESTIYNAVKQP